MHICDECGATFSRRSLLLGHKKKHQEGPPFSCNECHQEYENEDDWLDHRETGCNASPKLRHLSYGWRPKATKIAVAGKRRWKCSECGKAFVSLATRKSHERNVHNPVYAFKCEECGKSFYKKYNFKKHMETHKDARPHKCKECGKMFKTSEGLRMHLKSHSEVRPYMCEFCGKVFKTRSVLDSHTAFHTDETKYRCSVCGKAYKYRTSLFIHLRTHTGHRPYECNECNASFIVKSHLTEHIRIHTGEHPFVCDVCSTSFTRASSLQKHLKSHIRAGCDVNLDVAMYYAKVNARVKPRKSIGSFNESEEQVLVPRVTHIFQENTISDELTVVGTAELYVNVHVDEKDCVTLQISALGEGSTCTHEVPQKPLYDLPHHIHRTEREPENLISSPSNGTNLSKSSKEILSVERDVVSSIVNIENVTLVKEIEDFDQPQSCNVNLILNDNKDLVPEDQSIVLSKPISTDKAKFKSANSNSKCHTQPKECRICKRKVPHSIMSNNLVCYKCTSLGEPQPQLPQNEASGTSKGKDAVFDFKDDQMGGAYQCGKCTASFSFRSKLRKHEKLHSSQYSHMCTSCGQSFQQEIFLAKHLCGSRLESQKCASKKSLTYKCDKCNKIFSKLFIYKVHYRKHTGRRPYKCRLCTKSFISATHHKVHMRLHTGERPYKCHNCTKCFIRKSSLANHKSCQKGKSCIAENGKDKNVLVEEPQDKKIHKKNSDIKNKIENQQDEIAAKTKLVTNALADITTQEDITIKEKSIDLREGSIDVSENTDKACHEYKPKRQRKKGKKNYLNCKHCGKVFQFPCKLEAHEKSHTGEKPFKCSYCGKGFSQKSNMETHIRVHTGERPFLCSYCGKVFAYKYALEAHKRTHTLECPFECNICGKTFRYSASHSVHMKRHIGERAFKCDQCPKSFVTKRDMENHCRTHTGEKPYHCEFCSQRFTHQHHLTDHRRIHTKEKPYKCEHCGMTFARSGTCKIHVQKHLKESR